MRKCWWQFFAVIRLTYNSKYDSNYYLLSLILRAVYHRTNQISLKFFLLHNFTKYFSGTRVYEIVNNCLFVVCYSRVLKEDVCKTFLPWRNGWCWKLSIRMFLKIMTLSNNAIYLQVLWSRSCVCLLFMIHEKLFSPKIWFVKTSTRNTNQESLNWNLGIPTIVCFGTCFGVSKFLCWLINRFLSLGADSENLLLDSAM